VGYVTGNTQDVILSVNADNSGIPGKSLKKWKAQIGGIAFGSCCQVSSKTGAISVKKGKQYWVVVRTEASSDIWAAWNINDTLQLSTDAVLEAGYADGTWTPYQGYPAFALEIDGK